MSRSRSGSPCARDRRRDDRYDRPSYKRDSYDHHERSAGRDRPNYGGRQDEYSRRSQRDGSQRRRNPRDKSPNTRESTYRASYRPVNEKPHAQDARGGYRRSYSPSESPHNRIDASKAQQATKADGSQIDTPSQIDNGDLEAGSADNEEAQMAALMGFGGFSTTKGEKVKGNAKGGVAKAAKRIEYRQYMNRPGGFNRALDDVP